MTLQQQVDKFNKDCPVGTAVVVRMDDGRRIRSTVRAPAEILGCHPVGWVEKIRSCYSLARIYAVHRTIVSAAIRIGEVVHVVPQPGRHHDVIHQIVKNGGKEPVVGEQGFVDSLGTFHTRANAATVAWTAGQLPDKKEPPAELFTEDLW